MKKLIGELVVLVMIGAVSAGAFAQKGGDKRPPKEPERVRSPKPQPTPPPQNTNRPPADHKKKP